MAHNRRIFRPTTVSRATAYDEQPVDGEFVIPEDITALSAADLDTLHDQAVEAFNAIYQDGQVTLDDDAMEALRALNTGITAIRERQGVLAAADNERADEAAALAAAIVAPAEASTDAPEGDESEESDEDADDAEGEEEPEAVEGEEAPEAIAASGRREVRVNLSGIRSRQQVRTPAQPTPTGDQPRTMRDIVFAAPNLSGFREGQGMNWDDLSVATDRLLNNYNHNQYAQAARAGRVMKQQFGLATFTKEFDPDLVITSDMSEGRISTILDRAADTTRLPGGALTAAGWCAPSTTIYDLCEMESRDGLYDLPEVQSPRGGIRSSLGPAFSTLFNDIGFSYTEQEAIDGDWDGEGGGSKPCYSIECPDFTDTRLGVDGLCITAGLLQRRGYPELIQRVLRGAVVAHDHRVAGGKVARVASLSTAVSMPASQVGATAPILTAVELQTEHYRESRRIARNTVLEAVFPYWVRGAIRADLSRRLGVAEFDVPDSRIDAWFRQRMVAPQFIYNWQGLATSTPASGRTSYPTSVDFLLYAAGTWVAIGSDVITLDTVYDSTLLGTNDYTALFSEEGWNVVQRCEDSRIVTVPICPDGATHIGVAIDCDGSEGA